MQELIQTGADNLLSPMILFFLLGLGAGAAKSELEIPDAVGKALSIYLIFAIGFKGGVELTVSGRGGAVALAMVAAVLISLTLPVVAYGLLRLSTRLDRTNAAAIAAHYGSVSVVTFVTASAFLDHASIPFEGFLVAMMAAMETPAILSGLMLARRGASAGSAVRNGKAVLHEVLLSGSVVLLLGSFVIGWATGPRGMGMIGPFVEAPFTGILCLFLLDMGLLASRRLADFRTAGAGLLAFGLYMPFVGAALGLAASSLLGLSVGGATLLIVLAASSSYIVVPAAVRLALPAANPSIYITLSLGVTFPFNIVFGIPIYHFVARTFI